MRRSLALWTTLSLFGAPVAGAGEPTPFAYEKSIVIERDAPIQTLRLDLEVYRGVVASLRDLRVYNAEGRVVPHALRPVPATGGRSRAVSVPVFALEGGREAGLPYRVEAQVAETEARIEIGGGSEAGSPARGVLIDTDEIEEPISAIELAFGEDEPDFVSELRVEASDDLERFVTLADRATIAQLGDGTARIDRRRIEFRASPARYLRITFVSGGTAPTITGAKAITAPPDSAPAQEEVRVGPRRVPGEPEAIVYDLGARLPVTEVEVLLAGRNPVLEVAISARAAPDAAGTLEYAGLVHALGAEDGDVPRAIRIATRRPSQLELRARGASGLPDELPDLLVRWRPDELIFVAEGSPPYTLGYGRAGAEDVALRASALLATVPDGAVPSGPSARLGPQRIALGDSALEPPLPLRTLGLWLFLVLAVGAVLTLSVRALTNSRS